MPSLGDFTDFDQAADQAEQVEPDTFTFYGETFTVADRVSSVPMMRLAKAAAAGLDTNDVEGLTALHDFLEQTLIEGDFRRFTDLVMRHKVSDDAMLAIAKRIYEVISARPTTRPSTSTPGGPRTSPNSKPTSPAMRNAGLSETDMVSPEGAVELLRAVV